jgi:hypothetical protein
MNDNGRTIASNKMKVMQDLSASPIKRERVLVLLVA